MGGVSHRRGSDEMLSARLSAHNCTEGLTCSAYIDAHPSSRLSSPDFTRPSLDRRSQASRFHHGSSMGWIPLKIEHTSPGPSPCPWAQRETSGTYLWVTAGISYPYESTTQVPWGTWNEDLSPYDSRNLALTSQVLLGPGCPQG